MPATAGTGSVSGQAGASEATAYDSVTILFHWIIALLVLAMFMLVLVPGVVKGSVALHKSLGVVILVVVPLRIVWRLLLGRRLAPPAGMPWLLQLGAKGAHLALYGLLLLIPILGWLYQDAKAIDVDLFGTDVELPMLLYYDRALALKIYAVKKVAAYLLLALIGAHAAAAIGYHALIRRDGVLSAMLPRRLRRMASG